PFVVKIICFLSCSRHLWPHPPPHPFVIAAGRGIPGGYPCFYGKNPKGEKDAHGEKQADLQKRYGQIEGCQTI
ncbi:MAG: hypothetical protein JW709_07850, partial [Sedimentisphaerales bacterium]|nr:hypothetical protein [Sedimentisphaerales bacterium]